MDSGRQAVYIVIGVLWLFQDIYMAIIKRKDKNFYKEPKLINLLTGGISIVLLLYDFAGVWEPGMDRGTDIVIVSLVLVLLMIFLVYRNFSTGKNYTVNNISKTDLKEILLRTLEKYGLEYTVKEKHPDSILFEVFLEEYDASVKMTQKGGSGKNFQLVFVKFDHVYYFEDIILDIKEGINKSTQASRFRGVSEMALAVGILAAGFWLNVL